MNKRDLKVLGIVILCTLAAAILMVLAILIGGASDAKKGMKVLSGEAVHY